MRQVPGLWRGFLEDRRIGVENETTGFVQAARGIKRRTGTFPASYDVAEFERRQYWRGDDIRLGYRPDDAGRSFRLCIQHGDDGPWRAFDSNAGAVVALGDQGPCTFRPPRPGSEAAVRLAAERIAPAMEAVDAADVRVPSARADRILARFDVDLGPGVSLVRAADILDEENYPSGYRYCVQHGRRGAWAVADTSVGILSGPSGECDWRLRTAPDVH